METARGKDINPVSGGSADVRAGAPWAAGLLWVNLVKVRIGRGSCGVLLLTGMALWLWESMSDNNSAAGNKPGRILSQDKQRVLTRLCAEYRRGTALPDGFGGNQEESSLSIAIKGFNFCTFFVKRSFFYCFLCSVF